jgi:repressor LexA
MYYTPKQLAIVKFIDECRKRNGISPTLEEIGQQFNVSKITIFEHIGALEKKGAVSRVKGRSRSVEVIDPEFSNHNGLSVPMAGVIAAGRPIEAVEVSEKLDLSSWLPDNKQCFALKVKGDSMIDDHIREGDLVIVESRANAENGETVVAILEHQEATLKRFYRENGRIRLQPANDNYPPVITDSVEIRGVVVGVLRKY